MIDIQYIRDNPKDVEVKSKQKGYPVDVSSLLKLDEQRRSLLVSIDHLRTQRNDLSRAAKGRKPSEAEQAKGRDLKQTLSIEEAKLKLVDEQFYLALRAVPNMPLSIVPIGSSEDDNVIVKTVNPKPKFTFEPKAHHLIGESRDFIDKTRAAKVSGSRFAYIKGDLVRLQFAIVSYVISLLTSRDFIDQILKEQNLDLINHPFVPVIPPAMLKTAPYQASSRLNAEEVTYKIEQDDLWLNASAEHTLCTMLMDEIISVKELPLRYLGYSTSFRREAGTYGKDEEGIFRLHQFDKLEMEVFSTPETALAEHQLLIGIQEHLLNQLGLSYQLIEKCSADIGKPNAKGVDINTWFPGQNRYRETHSSDYISDYQSRDLKIRLKRADGSLEFVHTNDATVFALGRFMAAIIENFQNEDQSVNIPIVLQPFMGGTKTI